MIEKGRPDYHQVVQERFDDIFDSALWSDDLSQIIQEIKELGLPAAHPTYTTEQVKRCIGYYRQDHQSKCTHTLYSRKLNLVKC